MELKTPKSLKAEHEELHALLANAIKAGRATGESAKAVAKVLHPHFLKEKEYALPPLGLLPILAEGKTPSEMEFAMEMTERLKGRIKAICFRSISRS